MANTRARVTSHFIEDRRKVNGHQYKLTTDPSAISLSALNAAFEEFGAKPLPKGQLKQLISTSFCFVILHFPASSLSLVSDAHADGQQVGYCRLVTDHVTRCDLVEVYVLPEHQKKGLGTWMMGHVETVLEGMQWLRSCWIMTEEVWIADWYRRTLGVEQVASGRDLQVLVRYGKGQ